MNYIKFSDGSVLGLNTSNEFSGLIKSVIFREELYGTVPTLDIDIQSDKELYKVNDQVNGYLTHPNGLRQNFVGYVYSFKYYNGNQSIKILLIDKSMVDTIQVCDYNGIIQAIYGTYKGAMLTKLTYNDPIDNNNKIYQKYVSNLEFCTKCCWCYRYDNIFGYLINGLKFIDLNNIQPIDTLSSSSNLHISNNPEFSSTPLFELNSEDTDFSLGDDINHVNVSFNGYVTAVNKDYANAVNNYLHNKRYKSSKLKFDATSTQLFPYVCGDALYINSNQIQIKTAFISRRVIEFDKYTTKVHYEFQSNNL